MGQYFVLANLDTRQVELDKGKYGEFFFSGMSLDRFTKWKYPQERFDKAKAVIKRIVPEHTRLGPSCKILRVPNELIRMIFSHLDHVKDIMYLSLVDARLLTIGLDRVVEIHINRLRSCVGSRIICLGDYSSDEDYPESIKSFVDQELQECADLDKYEDEDRLFYALVCDTYDAISGDYFDDKDMDCTEQFRFVWRLGNKLWEDEEFTSAIGCFLSPRYWRKEPMSEVLCNITKRHYVRQAALDDLHSRRDDNSARFRRLAKPTLGHALLSQICWSSDASISMQNESLYQGPWVGDRFEVISSDDLERQKDFSEWVDVSNDIVVLLDGLWDDDFGWRAEE